MDVGIGLVRFKLALRRRGGFEGLDERIDVVAFNGVASVGNRGVKFADVVEPGSEARAQMVKTRLGKMVEDRDGEKRSRA